MGLAELNLLVRCVMAYKPRHGAIRLNKGEGRAAARLVHAGFLNTIDARGWESMVRPTQVQGDAIAHEFVGILGKMSKQPMNLNDLNLLVRVCWATMSAQKVVHLEKGEKSAAARLIKAGLLCACGGGDASYGVYPTDDGEALVHEFVAMMEIRPVERALEQG